MEKYNSSGYVIRNGDALKALEKKPDSSMLPCIMIPPIKMVGSGKITLDVGATFPFGNKFELMVHHVKDGQNVLDVYTNEHLKLLGHDYEEFWDEYGLRINVENGIEVNFKVFIDPKYVSKELYENVPIFTLDVKFSNMIEF